MEDKDNKLTGTQKTAIVLLSMSEENATKLFALMNEDEIREISHAMSNLGTVSPEVVDRVLTQFNSDLGGDNFIGSMHTTKRLLEKVLDKDRVNALIDEIQGPQGRDTWEKLGNVNEEILALYLRNEHPQTAALVISKVSADHAAKVLSNIPDDFAFEVMQRMLNMDSVKKEVLDRVEKILRAEFISNITKTQKLNSFEMMAEIFNNFDRNSEAKYMSMLEGKVPEAAQKIKDLMFTFDDLVKIDSKGIQTVLRSIDKSKLTIALKGGSEKIKEIFLSNMSQRASRILMDELQALGPIRIKEVDEAQAEIVNVTKELIAKGEVTISDGGKEEYI